MLDPTVGWPLAAGGWLQERVSSGACNRSYGDRGQIVMGGGGGGAEFCCPLFFWGMQPHIVCTLAVDVKGKTQTTHI